MDTSLSCQKAHFSLPADGHYLNCAYMSPLPRRAEAAGIRGIRRKRLPSRIRPSDFFDESDRVRQLFAQVIGVPDPQRIALVPGVSYGMAVVAKNLDLAAGQNVVMAEAQFPSNVYAWQRLAAEAGAELRTVAAPDGPDRGERWNERLLDAIDRHTGLVAMAPVHWADGTRFDLERIGARARDVGAAFVVDGTQSVGAMLFDTATLRPDALVCAAYKWLFGPYGLALTYLGPRFDGGIPLEETWLGRKGSEDFSGLTEYVDAYQPGAARFDMGQRSNPVMLPMAAAALEQLIEWGVARIQAYCTALTRELVAEARALGYAIEAPSWRGAHLFGIRVPEGVPMEAVRVQCEQRQVAVSVRGSAIRIAPNVYNDAADMAALRDVLRAAASADHSGG